MHHDREYILARLLAERFPARETLLRERHLPMYPDRPGVCGQGPSVYLMDLAAATERARFAELRVAAA